MLPIEEQPHPINEPTFSKHSASEWMEQKKYSQALMQLPLGKPTTILCEFVKEIFEIHSTALMLSERPDIRKTFETKWDFDQKTITVIPRVSALLAK